MGTQADFEADPRAIRKVRHFVTETLADDPRLDDVVLTASELAANVIMHAETSFTVRLVTEDRFVRLEVSDGSSIIPAVEDLADSQWGLRMIEQLSARWGIDPTETGKTVWAEFTEPDPGQG